MKINCKANKKINFTLLSTLLYKIIVLTVLSNKTNPKTLFRPKLSKLFKFLLETTIKKIHPTLTEINWLLTNRMECFKRITIKKKNNILLTKSPTNKSLTNQISNFLMKNPTTPKKKPTPIKISNSACPETTKIRFLITLLLHPATI